MIKYPKFEVSGLFFMLRRLKRSIAPARERKKKCKLRNFILSRTTFFPLNFIAKLDFDEMPEKNCRVPIFIPV